MRCLSEDICEKRTENRKKLPMWSAKTGKCFLCRVWLFNSNFEKWKVGPLLLNLEPHQARFTQCNRAHLTDGVTLSLQTNLIIMS